VDETSKGWKPSHANSSSQEVKQLTQEDLGNYTIHDVIMPLPGWNIDYPAGDIGELYTKILKEDGLDPKKMQRDQRYGLPYDLQGEILIISEYSLPGSYRKIIHLPKTFTWSHVSYTDPDISLVQSDEDKILGENPAAEDDPEGTSYPFPPSSVLHHPFLDSIVFCSLDIPLIFPFPSHILREAGSGKIADT
jgi:tRNA pseudouridine13 synthase